MAIVSSDIFVLEVGRRGDGDLLPATNENNPLRLLQI
jgi:hypothetical protein